MKPHASGFQALQRGTSAAVRFGMRANYDSINAPQLATATDRLLAQGRFTKRRGPRLARVWNQYADPEEITIRVSRAR